MRLTPLLNRAIGRAAYLHRDQKRKTNDNPAISHMFAVMVLLSEYTDDETVLAAALLHDVLEDVPGYGEAKMRAEFGDAVTDLVLEVSEKKDPNVEYDKRGTWRERKEGYLAKLRHDSREAVMLSAADRIHNLESLLDDLEEKGPEILGRFNSQPEEQAWFFGEVCRAIQERLDDHPLVNRLLAAIRRYRELAGLDQPA